MSFIRIIFSHLLSQISILKKEKGLHASQGIKIFILINLFLSFYYFMVSNSVALINADASNLEFSNHESSKLYPSASSGSAQNVVDFYRNVFTYDWNLGFEYNSSKDGLGFAQTYDTPGSGYKDYSIAPQNLEDNATVTPVLSPDNSYDEITKLVTSANSTLDIEQMYIKEGLDELVNAIIARKQAGVSVRIIVSASGSDQLPLNSFVSNGIPVRISKQDSDAGNYFDTMHNKGVIVDGKKVLISSINWSPNSFFNNREAGLIVESSKVSEYYGDLFDYDWNASAIYDNKSDFLNAGVNNVINIPETSNNDGQLMQPPESAADYTPVFSTVSYKSIMNFTAMAAPDNCFDIVSALILKANKSIDIAVYTLSSPYLMESLIDRIENGVKVRLLLEKQQVSSYEQNYNRWTMANLTTIEHNGKLAEGKWSNSSGDNAVFSYQHSKYAIIDNQTLILSSGNWGKSSCPKPKDYSGEGYANVDGNRDWWIVIYGSNPPAIPGMDGYNPESNDPLSDVLDNLFDFIIWLIIIAAIAGALYIVKNIL